VVAILDRMRVKFDSYDVTADDSLRQGIKDFSDWPTIPQLFIGGEFVGGSDIILELFNSGELNVMIEVAVADAQ
jgi:monothiol glutaredoxin